MSVFFFRVEDADGCWGELKVVADGKEEAEEEARRWLDACELSPNGSLLPGYQLKKKEAG